MKSALRSASIVVALVHSNLLAQGPSASSAADSVRLVRRAHSEQTSFELFRRHRLPEMPGGSGYCDARIGRYCYWRGNDNDEQVPVEKPEIIARRNELLAMLDSAIHVAPADAWVAGQTVRYLSEAGRTDDALQFTRRDCHAVASWCAALGGYAAHTGGRFATADSEFSNALASMDAAERSRWFDITDLLDGELGDRFESLGLEGRESLTRRIFWLGSPLLAMSGSDRLTEHFARVTRARMVEHSTNTDGNSWGDDQEQLMVRYGWSTWYSRERPDMGMSAEPRITGHDSGRPYDFLPSLRAVEHVGTMAEADWKLDDNRARNGYAPSFARSVHELPHQIARFRRGDSTLVVAAWDGRRDTTLLGRRLDAALVLGSDADHLTIARADSVRPIGRIAATGLIDSGLVSLEVFSPADKRAARARIGIPLRPSSTITLSDVMLYAPSLENPHTLDDVRDSAMTSAIVPASRTVGVFWETYGLPPASAPVHFTLTLEPMDVGWFRQVAEKLRFADPTRALRIQWDEVPLITNGLAGRGVRVDVSQLRAAKYRLRLSVDVRGELVAVSEREVEIR